MTAASWRPSRQAAKEQSGVAQGIDPQTAAAPLDGVALAGDQVLDRGHLTAIARHANLDIAERQPEFVHVARQRDRDDDAVGLIDRFLDEADDVAVIDRNEAQIAGLLQRRVCPAGAVEIADVGLDIAWLVPVPHLDLVFFGIEIFFAARYRLPLRVVSPRFN